ncbi:LLM class flavin-dependent oxidoreductase [Kitasatospora sp. NPDC088391]|uniref:LLM class flavin-dependent oxidoreductase n=1 Tax=Kitasatospora sp. NPDC088391 TaxID=3364074 RepID=UPI0037F996CB
MFLGVEIGEPGSAGAGCVRAARLAEQGAFAFVTLDESLVPPAGAGTAWPPAGQSRLNPVTALARVAPLTTSIGLLATTNVSHLEPFHVSKALATLDHVSSGRAGWCVRVSRGAEEAGLFGDLAPCDLSARYEEAAEFATVVALLWDSWADGAEIRDSATGRFLDGTRIRAVDHRGKYFRVKGPGIVPRPPQGHPVMAVRVDADEDLPLAACADLVLGRFDRVVAARPRLGPGSRTVADLYVDCRGLPPGRWAWGTDGPVTTGGVRDLAGFLRGAAETGAVDGFRLVLADPAVELGRFVAEAVPVLRADGLLPPAGGPDGARRTFRERLGLPHRAPNRLFP